MTLCIARRKNANDIELASDSRISLGSKHFDTGIKIFTLPVTISMPSSNDDLENETEENTLTFGLAIAGDTLHTYLVKEAITEILQNLQYIPGHTDLSIDKLCEFINRIFTQLAQDIDGARDRFISSGFIITGYCIEQQRVRAFKFETKQSGNGMVGGEYYEILNAKSNVIEFIGSGAELGRQIYEKHPNWHTLWILDEAVRSKHVDSVGGKLQYGCFHDKFSFYVSGIIDHIPNENDVLIPKMFLRGVDLYEQEFETGNFNYWVSYQFRDPFRPDIISTWNARNPEHQFIRS